MAKNIFTVDYDARVVDIVFKGEAFQFDLTEGDVGDFWSGFVMKDGSEWDINYHQEDETCEPVVAVYPARWIGDENGSYEIDTNHETLLDCIDIQGDSKDYFNNQNKPVEVGDIIGNRFKVRDIIPPIAEAETAQNTELIKQVLMDIIAKINDAGIGAWNANLENTVEAVALEDYYGDVESDEPTVKYNGWYDDLEKLVSSI